MGVDEMNPYYHAFQIGFNWYFVVAPILLVAMVVFEIQAVRFSDLKTLRIRRTHNNLATLVVSGLFTALVTVMIVAESGSGILQYFDNGLGRYESPFWSVVGLIITVPVIFILYWTLLYVVARIASWAKRGYLHEKRCHLEAARRETVVKKKPFLFDIPVDDQKPTGTN